MFHLPCRTAKLPALAQKTIALRRFRQVSKEKWASPFAPPEAGPPMAFPLSPSFTGRGSG